MNEAEIEEIQLSRVRNVGLDVQATLHAVESYKRGDKVWDCPCSACEYVRQSPQVMDAIARAVVKAHSK